MGVVKKMDWLKENIYVEVLLRQRYHDFTIDIFRGMFGLSFGKAISQNSFKLVFVKSLSLFSKQNNYCFGVLRVINCRKVIE